MRRKALAAVLFLVAPLTAGAAETYQIDTSHSRIGFAVRHMMVSTVRGSFLEYTGSARVDLEDLTQSSVEVTIEAASVDTDHERRDGDLHGEEFFDVADHPRITFRSTAVEAAGDELVVVGDLTIKGNTKSVRIPVELTGPVEDPWGNERLGVSGSLSVERDDYGLTYNRVLEAGGLVVGNEVTIELDIELMRPTDSG
jgi:polyisoprenoid-binding protein YceI